jgi:hypothetical protein
MARSATPRLCDPAVVTILSATHKTRQGMKRRLKNSRDARKQRHREEPSGDERRLSTPCRDAAIQVLWSALRRWIASLRSQ